MIEFHGADLTSPPNRIRAGFVALAVNVRNLLRGGFQLRNKIGNLLYTLAAEVQSLARMNDTTPQGPASGYTLISKDAAGNLYNNASKVASGLSANPVSIVPFQPNQSVQPWAYIGDSSENVTLLRQTATSLSPVVTGSAPAPWVNPAQVTTTVGHASVALTAGTGSGALSLTIGALAIPGSATITGIEIGITAYATSGSQSISAGIGLMGSTLAPPITPTNSPTPYIFGGPSFTWGLVLTPAMLNPGFVPLLSVDNLSGITTTTFINHAFVTIFYIDPVAVQTCSGMVKLRSDGLIRKTGIKEPQSPPLVGINTVNVTEWLSLPANTPPWTNIGGINANFNYSGLDTQPPFPATISTPVGGATVTLTVTGTATVNGASHAPGDAGPAGAGFPGNFITTPKIVVFAFTDATGNIIAQSTAGGAPPVVGNVGAGATLTVPFGAAQLQLGIDSQGGTFAANSGSFLVQAVVSTSSITQVASLVGLVTASVFGDSPHSGPVATYIWKNPNDSGTGIARTIGSAQAVATNNSLIMDSTPEDGTVPVLWSTLNSSGSTIGSITLFSPALESEGFQDFNVCITGSIFVPAGGTYAMQFQYKDQIMFGMGGGATSTGGAVFGPMGQAISVADGLPLLFVSLIDGSGGNHTTSINVTFPAQGIYPFEIDWVYWSHTGRTMQVQMAPTAGAGVAVLPPLPQGVRTGVQYWGKYRASETGAQSNPGPPSPIEETPVLANTVQLPWSNDPQADKVDYYRQDNSLANPTYVVTGPNDGLGGTVNGIVYNTAVEDTLDDLAAANNPIMARDDFEPFPSIDTPKSGMVTIVGGVITWVSGDQFNVRWLPGTLILIGFPSQNAYSLVARPISTTQIVIPTIPDTIGDAAGDGVPYNIAQPILAQQPLPYLFGPTDNIPFTCAVGDTLRPGTIYWSKGNNLDSAPDTNQQNLTDPSEALVNGAMSSGYAIVFSIKRAWIMVPNFYNAQATATGTSGSTWSFRSTSISRGLFIPRCLAVEGSGKTFFRVDDGWHFSQSGQGSVSITDHDLYPLFPHEGSTPTAITRNGVTIFPPDDTQPQAQRASIAGPYMYWDFLGTDANRYTLVFDINAMGWVLDLTTPKVTIHSSNQGLSTQGVLVGCLDGSIRPMLSAGAEAVTGTVVTPAIGGSGWQSIYEVTVEYSSNATETLSFVVGDAGNRSYAPSPLTLPNTGGAPTKYTTKVSANKWKWLQFQFSVNDPTMQVYLDGFAVEKRDWGAPGGYRTVQPFSGRAGGEGAQS